MYQRVLLMLVALSNNRLIRTASVYNELYHIVQELCQILFLYADINSVNKQMTDSTYKMNEHLKNNEDIKANTNIEFMESDFQTDISIIDENNSSMVMNMDDIIECKNIFFKKTMNKSNVSLYDIDIIEQLCNVLTTIGKNWLCVRGKIIEILLSNLYFNMNDPKSLQCTKLIAMAVSKLLYGFDVKAYIELDNWLIEIYGEGVLFEKPIQKTYLYMHV
uniref:Putative secreted protein n=1 Tax=Xenopsylla cheopis TaxID=163159 RepID=A0A6M2DWW9_XENCH